MADNSLKDDFRDLAKSMSDITKQTNDIRLKIRQDLVDSVKELSDITKEYNRDLKDQETVWGKLTGSYKNYSEQIRKATETEIAAEGRKKDLVVRLQQLRTKSYTANTRADRAVARMQADMAAQQLANLNQTIAGAQRLRNTLKDAQNQSAKLGSKLKEFLGLNFNKVISALSFKELVAFLGESNKQTVELAKTIGGSVDQAADLKFEFSKIAATTDKASINTKNLTEGFIELARNTQAAAGFTEDQVIAQTELTKLVGLQSKEATNLIELGILNNKTNEKVTSEILDQVKGLERETGIRLDGRKILAEVANINGQLSAQYQFNNKLLADAVVKVKQFGLNLREAEGIANNLLQFEQSISAELEAELLTGKNLNLERARLLALQGDTAGAAAEVAKQFGSAEEFTSMNVLQQRSLASAVGLTADQLADSIRQRDVLRSLGAENLKQLEEEGRLNELNGTEQGKALYQQYMQQSAQEKFNESITKLKGLVTSVVEAFTPIINIVTAVLDSSYALNMILGVMAAIQIPKIIAGYSAMVLRSKALLRLARMRGVANIFSGSFLGGPLGLVLAGAAVAAMATAIAKASKADDAFYGKNKLITGNKDQINFNNNDAILLAGTNMLGNPNRADKKSSFSTREDMDYLASKINSKRISFDSYDSAGPQAMVDSFSKNENNLFI